MTSELSAIRPLPRAAVVAAAREWLGTPYHHQASACGIGTDCVGLVRGVFRALSGADTPVPLAYSRDWAEASGRETLLEAAQVHLVEIAFADARPGDVLVFRFRPHAVAKHAGLLASPATIIHAVEGRVVSEVRFGGWWRRRVAGAFSFPGIID